MLADLFVQTALLPVGQAQIVVRLGVVGIDVQRGLVLADGLVQTALLPVGHTQVDVRISEVRVDAQRSLVLADLFVQTALPPIGPAQVVMRHSEVRVDAQRKLVLADSFVQTALLPVGHTQVDVRIDIVRIDAQRSLVLADSLIPVTAFCMAHPSVVVLLSQRDVHPARTHYLANLHCFSTQECPCQVSSGGPLLHPLRQRHRHHFLYPFRHIRPHPAHTTWLPLADRLRQQLVQPRLEQRRVGTRRLPRPPLQRTQIHIVPPRQHLVQQRTHLVDVAPPIHRLPAYLLRRHVDQRPWLKARSRQRTQVGPARTPGHVRDAKVPHLRPPLLRQQDVLRLHVPVDDAFGVGCRQPLAHLRRNARRIFNRQGATLLQQRAQAAARQVLHHQVKGGFHDLERVDSDDVGVVEATGGAGLLQEPLEGHLVGLGGSGQFLDGDRPVEERVVGQVDGAEGSPAQDALDAVFRELLVGGEGHSIPPLVRCTLDCSSLHFRRTTNHGVKHSISDNPPCR